MICPCTWNRTCPLSKMDQSVRQLERRFAGLHSQSVKILTLRVAVGGGLLPSGTNSSDSDVGSKLVGSIREKPTRE